MGELPDDPAGNLQENGVAEVLNDIEVGVEGHV